jgi:hypothetical protein
MEIPINLEDKERLYQLEQGKEQEALEINLAVSKVKVERLLESKMRRCYQLQPRQRAGGT